MHHKFATPGAIKLEFEAALQRLERPDLTSTLRAEADLEMARQLAFESDIETSSLENEPSVCLLVFLFCRFISRVLTFNVLRIRNVKRQGKPSSPLKSWQLTLLTREALPKSSYCQKVCFNIINDFFKSAFKSESQRWHTK